MAGTRNAGVRCRHVVTTGCASMKSQQRVYVPRAWHVPPARCVEARIAKDARRRSWPHDRREPGGHLT